MTLDEAVRHLAAMADVKRSLAAAPRTSELSRSMAHKHRVDGEAIDVVLAALRAAKPEPTCSSDRCWNPTSCKRAGRCRNDSIQQMPAPDPNGGA